MIDCFLIGHNEMQFEDYERSVRIMGGQSGAYRDLNMNFVRYKGKLSSCPDMFNALSGLEGKPVGMGSSFSATVAYLATYLHRKGYSFDYVNTFQEDREYLRQKLEEGNMMTVAITTTFYVSPMPIIEIMQFIKDCNPDVKVIIGGPFISTQARYRDGKAMQALLRSLRADYYINSSQGEATLSKLLGVLKTGGDLTDVENLYYLTDSGYASTPVVKEDNTLSENMVKWELFADRVEDYVMVRTSRSCPFRCSFCGFPQHAGRYQTAEMEAVEEELNGLSRIESLRHVDFVDDTFNVPPDRFKEILRMMVRNKYPWTWHSQYRCQFADEETVQLMAESGCQGVFLGIESGNNRILKNMNKSVTIEKYRSGIELLKKAGIPTFGCFIVGFPGETDESARDTFRFIEDSGLDYYRVQLWFCDPVTPIWEQKETYGIEGLHFKWKHNGMDYRRACDLIEEGFRGIKGALWVPQYNFEFDGLFHLRNRGLDWPRIRQFLQGFKQGLLDKLDDPSPDREVGGEALSAMQKACQ